MGPFEILSTIIMLVTIVLVVAAKRSSLPSR